MSGGPKTCALLRTLTLGIVVAIVGLSAQSPLARAATAPAISTPASYSWVPSGRVAFAGSADANAVVEVVENDAVIATATAGANGAWSATAALVDGDHVVNVRATSPDGSSATSSRATIVRVDTRPPAAPTIVTPAQ